MPLKYNQNSKKGAKICHHISIFRAFNAEIKCIWNWDRNTRRQNQKMNKDKTDVSSKDNYFKVICSLPICICHNTTP